MKTLLITGFEPFGGQNINPAWEAVSLLPDRIGDIEIHKLRVPVVYEEAASRAKEAAGKLSPDFVICVGQAGGRSSITPEMIAVNLRYAKIPDNAGVLLKDVPIREGGAPAFFATLPVRKMAEKVSETGIPASVSLSAGAFVCNDLFYLMSEHFAGTKTGVAFIHVPFLPEQAEDGRYPSLPLDDMVRALTLCIGCLSSGDVVI